MNLEKIFKAKCPACGARTFSRGWRARQIWLPIQCSACGVRFRSSVLFALIYSFFGIVAAIGCLLLFFAAYPFSKFMAFALFLLVIFIGACSPMIRIDLESVDGSPGKFRYLAQRRAFPVIIIGGIVIAMLSAWNNIPYLPAMGTLIAVLAAVIGAIDLMKPLRRKRDRRS